MRTKFFVSADLHLLKQGDFQATIAYLAAIQDHQIPYPTHQAYFWNRVRAALDPLHLTAEQRQHYEHKLQEVVPCPDSARSLAEIQTRSLFLLQQKWTEEDGRM